MRGRRRGLRRTPTTTPAARTPRASTIPRPTRRRTRTRSPAPRPPAPAAGGAGSRRSRPAAISATARGSSSCSIGRRPAWTVPRIARVGQLDRALQHDRARVDPLVDEVDRHAEDLDPVLDGLLDRAHAGEGGQQRGMDVEDPVGEARHEARVEDRHVAGEHDELDALARPASRRWRRRAPRARRTPSAGRPATARPPPRARSSARAEGWSQATATTSTSRPWTLSSSAWRFVPSPEARTPTLTARGPPRRAAWGRRRRWRPAAPRRAARRRAPAPRRRAGATNVP